MASMKIAVAVKTRLFEPSRNGRLATTPAIRGLVTSRSGFVRTVRKGMTEPSENNSANEEISINPKRPNS